MPETNRVYQGDCMAVMRGWPDGFVDTVLTDPPYGLGFMGKGWDSFGVAHIENQRKVDCIGQREGSAMIAGDYDHRRNREFQAWCQSWAAELLRVCKPGATLLCFGGTRTWHRLCCAIEDAGWEITDCLMWLYGSGFPKSLDISKAIDKAAGAEREVVGIAMGATPENPGYSGGLGADGTKAIAVTVPASEAAKLWDGWGTALKPAWESILVAQKPLDIPDLCAIMAQRIAESLCQLASSAKVVGDSLPSNLSALVVAAGSALWPAVGRCSTPGALCDLMATLPPESGIPTSLSIGLSWLSTLAEVSAAASTFTTATASAMITDLRTLSCLLSASTPECLIGAAISRLGIASSASLADGILAGVAARLASTRIASAPASATSPADGWGLVPNWEPIVFARKRCEGGFAANALKHGVAGLNIDGARIESGEPAQLWDKPRGGIWSPSDGKHGEIGSHDSDKGRWPANLILDEAAAALLDEQSGESISSGGQGAKISGYGVRFGGTRTAIQGDPGFGDSGGASRFFYTAKASSSERNAGLGEMNYCAVVSSIHGDMGDAKNPNLPRGNDHPTVKPLAVMEWLAKLTMTPTGGLVLDPFFGSGTTGVACNRVGRPWIGIELDPHYCDIARKRTAQAGIFTDTR